MMNAKQLLLSGSLAIAALFGTAQAAMAQVNEKTPSVDIQATAQREVMPDELILSITIRESDYKGKEKLDEKQEQMISVLRRLKIDYENALTIREMGSSVAFKLFSKNPSTRTEATYLLKLGDAATMQRVVAMLEECHISNIQLVQTRYTKKDELKVELGVEAMKKAQAEATALAGAVGQTVGKAISISSWMSDNAPQPRFYKMAAAPANAEMAMDNAAAGGSNTPGISGITFTVNVSAKFELK